MPLTEPDTSTPNGLPRFLGAHESCSNGLEVMRDNDLVTVICRGCETSFSYLTTVAPNEPTEVDVALEELAGSGGEPVSESPPPPLTQPSAPALPRRPAPPGPHARRRRRARPSPAVVPSKLGAALESAGETISRRRKPIALAALALAGGYVLLGLSAGSAPSPSEGGPPVGGPDLPLAAPEVEAAAEPAEAPVAGDARTLESAEDGGPDAEPFTGPGGRYELTLPPDWTRERTDRGSTRLRSAGGDAEITIRVQRGALPLGELAGRAAIALGERTGLGAPERAESRSLGELLVVARARSRSGSATAYVAEAGGLQFIAISERSDDASALVRLQAEGIVRSFRPSR